MVIGDFIWEEGSEGLEEGLLFEWKCWWDVVCRVVVFLGGEDLFFSKIFRFWFRIVGEFGKFGGGLDGKGGGEDLGRGGRFLLLLLELKIIRLLLFVWDLFVWLRWWRFWMCWLILFVYEFKFFCEDMSFGLEMSLFELWVLLWEEGIVFWILELLIIFE